MALLNDLRHEERELVKWIEANDETAPDKFDMEGAKIRLQKVRELIDRLDQPMDFGGWEDH